MRYVSYVSYPRYFFSFETRSSQSKKCLDTAINLQQQNEGGHLRVHFLIGEDLR